MNKLNEIMSDVLGIAPQDIKETLSQQDLDSWDSLGHLNLVDTIEEEFDLDLSIDDASAMNSYQGIKEVLKKHGVHDL